MLAFSFISLSFLNVGLSKMQHYGFMNTSILEFCVKWMLNCATIIIILLECSSPIRPLPRGSLTVHCMKAIKIELLISFCCLQLIDVTLSVGNHRKCISST